MAIHSSVLAWRIPGMAEPGLLSMGHTESDPTEATQHQQQQQNGHNKIQKIASVDGDTKKLKTLNIASWITKYCSHYGKYLAIPL